MHRVLLFLLVLVSPSSFADESYAEVQELINEALDAGNFEHESWYRAAELINEPFAQGASWAKFYVAFLYAFGTGGYPIDHAKAEQLENSAANEGFLPAVVAQARRNEHGLSGTIDFAVAYSWYKKAALSGSYSAAARLEKAFTNGELALEVDLEAAAKWRKIKGECKSP